VLDSFVYIQREYRAFSVAFFSPLVWPNAGRQPLPEAGAQRTLEAVGWTPLLGAARWKAFGLPTAHTTAPIAPSAWLEPL